MAYKIKEETKIYNDYGGFHSLCDNIKNDDQLKLSGRMKDSMYWFTKIFSISNSKSDPIFECEWLKEQINFWSDYDPEKKTNGELPNTYKQFLTKGHWAGGIKYNTYHKKFLPFLTAYLVKTSENHSIICYHNFDVIKENLKFVLSNRLDTTAKRFVLQDNAEVFKFVLDSEKNRLEQALPAKSKLEKLRSNDPYAALTWLLILSLYPDSGDNDLLTQMLLNPFERSYSDEIIIPNCLKYGMSSYTEQISAASIALRCNEYVIKRDFDIFLDKSSYETAHFDKPKIMLFLHLTLLKAKEIYSKHNNDYDMLFEALNYTNYALEFIDFRNHRDNDGYLEGVQLLLLKSDIYWKMMDYKKMQSTLEDIEEKFYSNRDFTDNHTDLLGTVKRKQGIYYNRILDFNKAIDSYRYAYFFFAFSPNKKYERSKIMNNEGVIYSRWCKYDEAYRHYIDAYNSRTDRIVYDPNSVYLVYANMSITLKIIKNFSDAIKYINAAYEYRKNAFKSGEEKLRMRYISTTITFAAIYTACAVKNVNENKVQYFDKAQEKFDEAEDMLDKQKYNRSSFQTYVDFYLNKGTYQYFKGDYKISLISLKNAKDIYTHPDIEGIAQASKRILAVIYLYMGKASYAKGDYDECTEFIWKAFRITKTLFDESSDKSYYRYAFMVSCFHFAASFYLLNEQQQTTISSRYMNAYNEKCDIDSILESARSDIRILMNNSPNLPSGYIFDGKNIDFCGINKKAFEDEEEHINEFINLSKNKDNPDTKKMTKHFLDFYLIINSDE